MNAKRNLIVFALASVLVLSILTSASMLIPANENAKENAKAPENSPVISNNWDLERVDFIHYAKSDINKNAKNPGACYKLMGVKWTSLPVNYAINPSNPQGLGESFITNAISTSAETWDAKTSSELFSNLYDVDYSAQYGVLDSKNSIVFGTYPDNNVIAVTSIWFVRASKRIVEFDMLFNTYYNWGDASSNPLSMDLQNIATHELGHSVGLDDIYSSSCSAVTMFGYSSEGEISKRTLENADILGLQKIYGL